MLPEPSTSPSQTIGKLCIGGDWACAHGDFAGLRHVATQLQDFASEPIHCQLIELASACLANPRRASELWARLKGSLYRDA